ncbi:ATP-binding cassette domain-containing protein [Staphylococcus saprophyticus]|nr:ATP-binding cassette domain-containing protein [Staphylococcus saprophyticus]MDW3862759.1 ATP-binding cassette domain-containing protein [Staphylococcus saprophyticus]MDW3909417.1 ATP-binding cassette domain-containing protein [Staphylococcus saprophyticus]MDW3925079.1 ATP-binding cassette domain-containing protein [Staphylococcus saprophyticus]MDW3965323.1 ATP-binding cassette domain-containing protein [Staphylococcus saprophyticus]MDW3975185.1 ATP-binding cassette domain-containing protei
MGKNGAGKTTLMKMIAKTKRPTSGAIFLMA